MTYILPDAAPYGLPSAGSVGSHPPGMSHPSGCLCSLPRNRPVAWFPASARWHVISAALRLPPYCGCPPWATLLTRCSASLRLPPSLPLMSPFGLPSAGYPASARWHVFRSQVFLPPPRKPRIKNIIPMVFKLLIFGNANGKSLS